MRFLKEDHSVLAALRFIDQQSKLLIVLLAVASAVLLRIIDALTAHSLLAGFFYLGPISFATWHAGPRWGIVVAIVSAILATVAIAPTEDASNAFRAVPWDTFLQLSVFLLVTLLVSALRAAQNQATALARTDALTGAANYRWFHEQLDHEILRCRRYHHPFTVIYGDLDNFKAVNDHWGHTTGDALLQEVVASMKSSVRGTDIVARLGGDEFAILLPETDQTSGHLVADQLQQRILDAMQRRGWPVRGSFGMVTCVDPPASVEALLDLADALMYAAKREGKGRVRQAIVTTSPRASEQIPEGSIVDTEELPAGSRRSNQAEVPRHTY